MEQRSEMVAPLKVALEYTSTAIVKPNVKAICTTLAIGSSQVLD